MHRCTAIILAIYSYFLSVEADRNIKIPTWEKAVEGISGAGVLYTICATILTCCLGGITIFAFMAIAFDVLFAAGMLAIAVMTRDGADSCKGNVQTPIGNGQANQDQGFGNFGNDAGENTTYKVHLGLACRLNTVAFAISIIAAFLFLCTAAMQVLLARKHKKEKRFGPSPKNNYTSGSGKGRWFGKKKGAKNTTTNDTEMGHDGLAPAAAQDSRYSHDTRYTGSTMAAGNGTSDKTDGYGPTHGQSHGHSGYYTQPTGTAASNPYGYNSNNTATNY